MLKRTLARLLFAFVTIASTGVAQSEDELVYKEFLVDDASNELLFVLSDRQGVSSCPTVDMKSTTFEQAKTSGAKILARALVPEAQGYVYWLAGANGTHTVYFVQIFVRNCIAGELTRERQDFIGDHTFDEARHYYEQVLAGRLSPN